MRRLALSRPPLRPNTTQGRHHHNPSNKPPRPKRKLPLQRHHRLPKPNKPNSHTHRPQNRSSRKHRRNPLLPDKGRRKRTKMASHTLTTRIRLKHTLDHKTRRPRKPSHRQSSHAHPMVRMGNTLPKKQPLGATNHNLTDSAAHSSRVCYPNNQKKETSTS